ncbi:nuclear transport factor 2 family protein [Prauserella flavalba]|uniref:SnoaL-like domain-containing protein n=1 Tax=Prauserella flavalba TaxID=1477506 RepID=A0A318M4M3_9PSEU|nr:nuclear transport factor 2 family protein [Prauserella flavalba]PXY37736.1 hypothetical protein BA062_03705 [Prauserella flavalba]
MLKGLTVRRTKRLLVLLLALAATLSLGTAATAGGRGELDQPRERLTERRTQEFLHALEREDVAALTAMVTADVTLTHPITFSGNQEPDGAYVGRAQVAGYFQQVADTMGRIEFTGERISVMAGGETSIVEAKGDFLTADGRPYRNVYLFRLDWERGRIADVAEYGNPITYCQTFPVAPVCG